MFLICHVHQKCVPCCLLPDNSLILRCGQQIMDLSFVTIAQKAGGGWGIAVKMNGMVGFYLGIVPTVQENYSWFIPYILK